MTRFGRQRLKPKCARKCEGVSRMDSQCLMLAVVQSEDAEAATQALTEAGLRVTRISSLGGFLRAGNVTLLLGLDRSQVPHAIKVLTDHCKQRTFYVNAAQMVDLHVGYALPVETIIGGANIFVMSVERVMRFGAQIEATPVEMQEGREGGMKMVIAIVPEQHANEILDALIEAQYRATLVSTTGGFLRKGNATLLIGVRDERADGVLQRIQGVCQAISLRGNSEAPWATTFVLNTEQYVQL
jgi:uncharacterized protein YaaQ